MKKNKVLNLEGHFSWLGNDKYFIETTQGCFVWSDPDKNGDNTLVEYQGGYADYLEEVKKEESQDQGVHIIRDYCGNNIRLVTLNHH